MEHPGLLVVNEGADGSGKETQTTLLCERVRAEGLRAYCFDFPTYGQDPVADLIRTMLRAMKEEWNARPWESKAVLFASNRSRFREEILGALKEPRSVVVCNRYVPSNQAHMAGYAEDQREWERRCAWVAHLEYDLLALPRPDIVLLHTMPPRVSDALLHAREQGSPDAHEAARPYQGRVTQCFQLLADREPGIWRHVPADRDGVVQDPASVHGRAWGALQAHPAWQAFVRQRVPARTTRA